MVKKYFNKNYFVFTGAALLLFATTFSIGNYALSKVQSSNKMDNNVQTVRTIDDAFDPSCGEDPRSRKVFQEGVEGSPVFASADSPTPASIHSDSAYYVPTVGGGHYPKLLPTPTAVARSQVTTTRPSRPIISLNVMLYPVTSFLGCDWHGYGPFSSSGSTPSLLLDESLGVTRGSSFIGSDLYGYGSLSGSGSTSSLRLFTEMNAVLRRKDKFDHHFTQRAYKRY